MNRELFPRCALLYLLLNYHQVFKNISKSHLSITLKVLLKVRISISKDSITLNQRQLKAHYFNIVFKAFIKVTLRIYIL